MVDLRHYDGGRVVVVASRVKVDESDVRGKKLGIWEKSRKDMAGFMYAGEQLWRWANR